MIENFSVKEFAVKKQIQKSMFLYGSFWVFLDLNNGNLRFKLLPRVLKLLHLREIGTVN